MYKRQSHYYGLLRRQEDKDVEALEQWVQAYPRDNVPRDNLALAEAGIGQHEKALASASEAMRLDPKDPYAYQNLAVDYLSLNRYDEAKAVAEQAIAQKAEPWSIHITLYGLAFLRGDEAAMRHEVERATGKMEEPNILLLQARGECALGEIKKAREGYAHAASAAQARGSKERGASVLAAEASCDAEAGFPQEARQTMNAALALSENIISRSLAARSFALSLIHI